MASPPPESDAVRVLLIDDDQDDFLLTREMLAEVPGGQYVLDWSSEYDKGLRAACEGDYDIILLDYKLGARSGLDLLPEARRRGCDAPVILLTGMSDHEIDLAAMQSGAADYLEKAHLDRMLLDRTIRYAIQQRKSEIELERRVKQRTEELDRANAALREADRRKDEFLATLAHELRNPLAPIRNALEILRMSDDNPDSAIAARGIVERQVAQLVRLIDDLLDVSRISRGKLRIAKETITIGEVIDAAVEQSKPLLDKARQVLTIDMPDEAIRLHGDRVRLAQVVANLLNNSAKYSEPGGRVLLSAGQSGQQIVVRVRDTGVGIPPEKLSQVFEPFTQIDSSSVRSHSGLGIGLSLAHRLVDLHGGKIEVHSGGSGAGSEFTVTLPIDADTL